MAENTVVKTGKNAPMATSTTLGGSPSPIHNPSSGTQASDGTARSAPSVGESSALATREDPVRPPTTRPAAAPQAKPMSTRWTLIATLSCS